MSAAVFAAAALAERARSLASREPLTIRVGHSPLDLETLVFGARRHSLTTYFGSRDAEPFDPEYREGYRVLVRDPRDDLSIAQVEAGAVISSVALRFRTSEPVFFECYGPQRVSLYGALRMEFCALEDVKLSLRHLKPPRMVHVAPNAWGAQ